MRKIIFTAEMRKRGDFYVFFIYASLRFCGSILLLTAVVAAQKIAVIAPEKNSAAQNFIETLEANFPTDVKILDDDLSDAAYRAQSFDAPFNLTLTQAKLVGAAVGCDFFLLVKSENLRRASLSGDDYYESYAAIFAASARTGRLVFFKLESREAKTEKKALSLLLDASKSPAAEIFERLKIVRLAERDEKPLPALESLPEENSPQANNFRPPLPYKRTSPIYTRLANLYRVEATVDAEIDVDEAGKITNIEIARWAGFGLDESVAENIRRMNWRAAARDGKPVSTRVLLRYNFRSIETEK